MSQLLNKFNLICESYKFGSPQNWYPLTTQVQHIYMAKKDRCQAHIKLEEIPMWTKGQNVYFIWEMFSNAISLLYCVHSLGLRHISLTQPTQQIANGGRGKFTWRMNQMLFFWQGWQAAEHMCNNSGLSLSLPSFSKLNNFSRAQITTHH
jgi:hypothetical protein